MSLTSSSMPARAKRGYFSLARLRRPFRTEAGVETIEATARNPAATTPACPLPDLTRPALWVFGTFILAAVMSGRCLYGDGSHEFVRVLEAGTFVPLLGLRNYASNCYEFFLVVAIKLGITDLGLLRIAFGLGCFLPWPVALWVCHRFAPRHFWLVVLACAGGYMNAAFLAVGEHVIAHAFFWICLFALLYVRPLTPLAGGLLLLSAVILCRSYESLLFLGPPLAGIALWRAAGRPVRWVERLTLLVASVCFLVATATSLRGTLFPEVPGNLSGFKQGLLSELLSPSWTFGWSLGWTLLFPGLMVSPTLRRDLSSKWLQGLLAAGLAVWGLGPILLPGLLMPRTQHSDRFLELLVPLALLPVALLLAWRPDGLQPYRTWLVRFSASFLLAQALWQLSATWQWTGFVGTLRGVLASRTGPLPVAATPIAAGVIDGQALNFDWWWANPSLSIVLSPGGQVRSMLMPPSPQKWEPFNPLDPRRLPKLERYGINYRAYVATLARTE